MSRALVRDAVFVESESEPKERWRSRPANDSSDQLLNEKLSGGEARIALFLSSSNRSMRFPPESSLVCSVRSFDAESRALRLDDRRVTQKPGSPLPVLVGSWVASHASRTTILNEGSPFLAQSLETLAR